MIDHLGITVGDLATSRGFYLAALEPLGIGIVMQVPIDPPVLGFGITGSTPVSLQSGKPSFWIAQGEGPNPKIHLAFVAGTRVTVDAFHAAALAAGGKDNGPPGLRPDYHPNYYAAFVLDPDGNNVEAVCHAPA